MGKWSRSDTRNLFVEASGKGMKITSLAPIYNRRGKIDKTRRLQIGASLSRFAQLLVFSF
jgi:hypothetical protein